MIAAVVTVVGCLAVSFWKIWLTRTRKRMSSTVCPEVFRNDWNWAAVENWDFLAVARAFWTWASVMLIPILWASAWYQ